MVFIFCKDRHFTSLLNPGIQDYKYICGLKRRTTQSDEKDTFSRLYATGNQQYIIRKTENCN